MTKEQKVDKLLTDYCKVYNAWLDSMHGVKLPTIKEREKWHRATKALYDHTGVEYPKYLAKEFKALHHV